MPTDIYDSGFYSGQGPASRKSADAIVPIIVEALAPSSIVDIGCGAGHWVKAFSEAGVKTCHGIDGPWARASSVLQADTELFECDFSQAPVPFSLKLPVPRYDLVTSFEFVEHIDPSRAEALVRLFCSLSDTVILAGAIPHQTGVHHVNEQWPQYWSALFAEQGYACCDFIRPKVWEDDRVEPWYAQNTLAYFKTSAPKPIQDLARRNWQELAARPGNLVHPALWEYVHPPLTVRRAAFNLARAIKRAVAG